MATKTFTLNMNGRLVGEDGRLAFLALAPRFVSLSEASEWLAGQGIAGVVSGRTEG